MQTQLSSLEAQGCCCTTGHSIKALLAEQLEHMHEAQCTDTWQADRPSTNSIMQNFVHYHIHCGDIGYREGDDRAE